MQPARPPLRPPGSFSPLPGSSTVGGGSGSGSAVLSSTDVSRAPPGRTKRLESSSSDDSAPLTVVKARSQAAVAAAASSAQQQQQQHQHHNSSATSIYTSFTAHGNGSTSSLQTNFSCRTISTAVSAAQRSVAGLHSPSERERERGAHSPLTLPPSISPSSSTFSSRSGHSRKHSQNAGMFAPTLPSTSTSNLSHLSSEMAQSSPKILPAPHRELSASQIAAQAAVLHHQQQQQQQQQQQNMLQHTRQRSQTVPVPGDNYDASTGASVLKRGSGGPLSPPLLSLTEASGPRESGFVNQGYHNGLLGSHTMAATAAANVVFPRSGQSSPGLPTTTQTPPSPPPPPPPEKKEKQKVKLFSRPVKIGVKDTKDKPLPSPGKIGQALSNLQRGNFSTTSLESTAHSFYTLGNSSSATIRPADAAQGEKEGKEKEKKHHFLSRQKNKLKDEFHLPLSSAMSNSKPTDPSAPSSLYNFHLPPSPGPNSTSFKSMSGLDLRHGGRGLRDKKKDTFDDAASSYTSEWPGPSSVSSAPGGTVGLSPYLNEPFDSGKYGLNNMTVDDAWPFLKAKLLVIFEGEDLRLPVEDFNRIVTMHIQYSISRRSPNIIVDDLRELFATGFSSLDHTLRKTPEDRLIPSLVELWMFSFTSVLPYMQAVFLPLDLEWSGNGPLMTPEQARDFWGGVMAASSPVETSVTINQNLSMTLVSSVLDVRRMVLLAFRDIVILPRYETLKTMFSRLSLEFLPQSLASIALASPMPVPSPSYQPQSQQQMMAGSPADSQASFGFGSLSTSAGAVQSPGTAMSLDPSVASYNSTGTTLLGDNGSGGGGSGSRSRAISNVSFGSDNTGNRPFTPSSMHTLGNANNNNSNGSVEGEAAGPSRRMGGGVSSLREQNVEDSKQVTDMVGRMLQCMSVLASVGYTPGIPGPGVGGDEGNRMIEELNKLLKLNWLGRGRTGRNRRGIVGGRVRRDGLAAAIAAAAEPALREA